MGEEKGQHLGTYEISRKRYYKRVFVVTALLMIIAYAVLNMLVLETEVILVGLLCVSLFVFFQLAFTHLQYFYHRFWIKAYDKGLEIYQLGFFVWEDVFIHHENRKNSLLLKNAYIRDPEQAWPKFLNASVVKFKNWGDDDVSSANHIFFLLNLPAWVTNMSFTDFVKIFDTKTKIHAPFDTVTRKERKR